MNQAEEPTLTTTIFTARRIITMNPARPSAEAVAVRDGRILAVGSVDELTAWGEHEVDSRFSDHVLAPGFVEAHSHAMVGGLWAMPYVGYFDRVAPDGTLWPGCKSIDEVLDRLRSVAADMDDPSETLVAWGLDPIYFDADDRLLAEHLDRVSDSRPIFVIHVSFHLATVNSALLAAEGIDRHTPTPGVSRRADGEPDGELQEPAAMSLAAEAFTKFRQLMATDDAPWNYAREARNAGHTTITDLGTTPAVRPRAAGEVAAGHGRSRVSGPGHGGRRARHRWRGRPRRVRGLGRRSAGQRHHRRQAPLRHRQDHPRWLHSGIHRPDQLAPLLLGTG